MNKFKIVVTFRHSVFMANNIAPRHYRHGRDRDDHRPLRRRVYTGGHERLCLSDHRLRQPRADHAQHEEDTGILL